MEIINYCPNCKEKTITERTIQTIATIKNEHEPYYEYVCTVCKTEY